MKIFYDKETDAAYIQLSQEKPTGVIEVKDGFNVDTTDKGEIIGIEILEASKKIPINSLFSLEIDTEELLKTNP